MKYFFFIFFMALSFPSHSHNSWTLDNLRLTAGANHPPALQSNTVKPQIKKAQTAGAQNHPSALQPNKANPQTTTPASAKDPLNFQSNNKKPQAKGLVLAFKLWPKGKERASLLARLKKAGLKKRAEYEMFKTWVFEWPDLQKAERAEKLCGELAGLPFLDYCEPDYLLRPAVGKLRKKVEKKLHRKRSESIGPQTPPKSNLKLRPPPIPSDPNQRGTLKSCNIVASQLNLLKGHLGDYWAQERVGADLAKEELKKAPSIKKHLVAVFDSKYTFRHDMGVKNIISGSGPQAALPPLGDNMSYADADLPSYYLHHANYYSKMVNKNCGNKEAESQPPPDNDHGGR